MYKNYVLCGLLLLSACKKNVYNLCLEKIWEIGTNDEKSPYFFAFVYDAAVDNNGNLWTMDLKLGIIKEFDRNGKIVTSFGKKGNAPGELSSPNSIFVKNDTVYVRELFGEIEIFDSKGKHIRTIGKLGPGNFIVLGKKGRILTNVQNKNKFNIYVISKIGNKIDSFGNPASIPKLLKKTLKISVDFPRRAFIYKNYLIVGYGFQYLIRFYDLTNKKIVKEFKRKIDYVSSMKSGLRPFSTVNIFADDDYIYYSYIINKKDSSYFYLDLWSWNGKYITTMELSGQLLAIDNEKNLYIEIFTPYVKICKFRLVKK